MTAARTPENHASLVALPTLVLDLETTGLDVRRDRIVQIGAVAMLGSRILDVPRIDQFIDPGLPIPASAQRIHGIGDADVTGAPSFSSYAEAFQRLLAGRVVVGHNIAFDLAVLRHEAARAGIAWRDPPSLDVALLMATLEPTLPDLGLETISAHLGVKITRRHNALADSMATAEVFTRVLARLRELDVRTLGEARGLGARRSDLALRQAEAGWHSMPGERVAPPAVVPPGRIDGYVFEKHVQDLLHAPPVMVAGDAALEEAARLMVERRIGSLLVGKAGEPPRGIVTERDLLRAAARERGNFGTARVEDVMSAPVQTVAGEDMIYRALGRMDRLGIRHLCVVDHLGVPTGVLSQRDLLHHRARAALALDDALAVARDATELAAAYHRVPGVAQQLTNEGLGGTDVARVVSQELKALTARAAELAIERMRADGQGDPPAAWCLLLLGSGGRGESLLGADQDNALIHAGASEDDPWFAAFGAVVADLLDEAGVPRCKGGVMAANAEWRGTEAQWSTRVADWLRRARPEDLLNVDIFFDLTPAAGDASLARMLKTRAVEAASRASTFLALLAQSTYSVAPRFDIFGRPRVESGRVDVKRDGLLPLVCCARTIALRIGSFARSTPARLRDIVAAGRLPEGDASALTEAQAELLGFALRQQLRDLEAGVRPSSRVALKSLTRTELARLKRHLHRIDSVLRELHSFISA
jgi:DNA polymerase-3 subunit epsilon/CBS domain-containing protein